MAEEEYGRRVVEAMKRLRRRKEESALIWGAELWKCGQGLGLGSAGAELGEILVSQLCFSNNHPALWNFIHHSLSSALLLYPPQILSLLTPRVVPNRWSQPGAFRLYLELLSRYAFSFYPLPAHSHKIIKSVDVSLQLSNTYGLPVSELGLALVLYFFTIVNCLVDSILDDADGNSGPLPSEDTQMMHSDFEEHTKHLHKQSIKTKNSVMVLEVLVKLTDNQKAIILLRLVHLNMPEKFDILLQRMKKLDSHRLLSSNLKSQRDLILKLSANIRKASVLECQLEKFGLIGSLTKVGLSKLSSCRNTEAGLFACWVPFDVSMEYIMDAKHIPVTSAVDILADTISTLQVFNEASWQETFLALWISALRLVQREHDPVEGPIPHLDARLCILLSVVPLAITHVLEYDSALCYSSSEGLSSRLMETGDIINDNDHASKKQGLTLSLQVLGRYPTLLSPPASVISAATDAASKAANFLTKSKNMKNGLTADGCGDASRKASDMRHLIVEACITRKLIDTSAYFWPGYVSDSVMLVSDPLPFQKSPWSTFMEGAPLTTALVNSLISTPASSLVELEKLYHISLNGSEEEKSAAAKILCGASLIRGWNIQEHVVRFVVKLLSPPVSQDFSGTRSHLVDHMAMLSAILSGASSIESVHILSLHGLVPEVAASLMPLCETFGSLIPTSNHKLSSYDEGSAYMVFSSAFLFLLRLWKFYKPPLEQSITGRGGAIGGELTLEYLLLLHNSRIQSTTSIPQNELSICSDVKLSASNKPVYIDFYPKLRTWYNQNKSCIASTLSGLASGNPVHQVANQILKMLYWTMTNGMNSGDSSVPSSNVGGSTTTATREDACERPMLPAWEILEAIPYVLDAMLTACACGRLSSRDLTTGLRDLVDFLPASLGTIISYFAAEVTRGIWKPVPMNGIDWPSPAPNFVSVESEIRGILAAVGVDIPSCSSAVSSAMLPLPMAVLVSLTITFKLDKSLEYIHAVAGPALEICALGCSWPSMPIMGSLWAQKVRRWHDFIVVSCSRSAFIQNREAVAQLLRSCFTSFLGSHLSTSLLPTRGGANGLLGTVISARTLCPPVAPGFLYLRSCRTIYDVQYLNNVILEIVAEFARALGARGANTGSQRLKSAQVSLAVATSRAKEAATLGASLLCVAGGLKLVQDLYQEILPTWLLSARKEKFDKVSAESRILEGYALAYLVVLSGALMWGFDTKRPQCALSLRSRVIGSHMDFVAGVLDGNIALGCDPATWKSYVCCLVGLLVSFSPSWIQDVKLEHLRSLANCLRGWNESELAISILGRGGPAAMGSAAELLYFT